MVLVCSQMSGEERIILGIILVTFGHQGGGKLLTYSSQTAEYGETTGRRPQAGPLPPHVITRVPQLSPMGFPVLAFPSATSLPLSPDLYLPKPTQEPAIQIPRQKSAPAGINILLLAAHGDFPLWRRRNSRSHHARKANQASCGTSTRWWPRTKCSWSRRPDPTTVPGAPASITSPELSIGPGCPAQSASVAARTATISGECHRH